MLETVTAPGGIPIRLTDERWSHITEEHSELAGMRFEILEAVAQPERIYRGSTGELFAVKERKEGKFLIVVYREMGVDGFIITAFLTRRIKSFERRELIWSTPKSTIT